jgi:maleylacetate reductase
LQVISSQEQARLRRGAALLPINDERGPNTVYQTTIELSPMQRVYSGRPAAAALAEEAERQGAKRVFVISSNTLANKTDELGHLKRALGAKFVGVFDSIAPHVPREDVSAGVAAAERASPDMLASIGGGSVTDATKIINLCLKHGLRTPESMEAYRIVVNADRSVTMPGFAGPDLPVVSIPTTLSGGEFNALSGATDKKVNVKQGYAHPAMTARAVILDPAVTIYTPDWIWFSTGVRALDHCFETLGALNSNDYWDGMAMNGLRLLAKGLLASKANYKDLAARQQCQMGAWCSMVAIVAGLPMGISHATGHALGGSFNVPHGYTSCVMAPFALEFNADVNGDRQALISLALGEPTTPAHVLADRLIRALEMPRSLASVGLHEKDLEPLAGYVLQDIWCGTNPKPIKDREAIVHFLRRAM